MSLRKTILKEKPYIAYIRRLCALEDRRMESRLQRAHRRMYRKVVSWVRLLGCTLEDAEDVSSQVWTELLVCVRSRRIRRWNDGIVYRLARHRFIDEMRRRRKRERLIQNWKTADVEDTNIETDILIRDLVVALPVGERAVVEKVYLDGCTLAESASDLSISVSTVKRLRSRALAWMRSQVMTEGEFVQARS
jgi:RNA polymerase sigma factor (sigma-70 family)